VLRVEETPLQVAARGALQEQEVGGGCHALGGGGGDDVGEGCGESEEKVPWDACNGRCVTDDCWRIMMDADVC